MLLYDSSQMTDRLLFLYKFIKYPKQVGSMVPSSKALIKKMLKPIDWTQVKTVVELGAGTGVITLGIQKNRTLDSIFLSFEKDTEMRGKLMKQFKQVAFHKDACNLRVVLTNHEIKEVDCILSGLPFANFTQEVRDCIMQEAYDCLKPGGYFVAFQYSLQMKKQLKRMFSKVSIQIVPYNFPPAFVYICEK